MEYYYQRSNSFSHRITKPYVFRTRSYSEVNFNVDKRKSFNGRVTAATIIISDLDGLESVCENYNNGDTSKLYKDRPHKTYGLTMEQIKLFPAAKYNYMSSLITSEMETKASKSSTNYKFGWDFVLKDAIIHDRFGKLPSNLGIMCEVVLPDEMHKYPNIDLTTITEKTERSDKDIIYTAKRGAYEEVGIDFFSESGKMIFHPNYQTLMRKKYCPKLPYNFCIGSFGNATECLVVLTESEHLEECQYFVDSIEKNYNRYERMARNLTNI